MDMDRTWKNKTGTGLNSSFMLAIFHSATSFYSQ